MHSFGLIRLLAEPQLCSIVRLSDPIISAAQALAATKLSAGERSVFEFEFVVVVAVGLTNWTELTT